MSPCKPEAGEDSFEATGFHPHLCSAWGLGESSKEHPPAPHPRPWPQGRDGGTAHRDARWEGPEGEVRAWDGGGLGDVGSGIATLTRRPQEFKNRGCLRLPWQSRG